MVIYLEKMMERLNSGDERSIFGNDLVQSQHWSDEKWKQKAEETRKDFNIVLIHQHKKFFISELFKVIQEVISLILHYRTKY